MSALAVHTGSLQRRHRDRVREILDSTGVFRPDEIDVALELFDEAILAPDHGRTDEKLAGGQSSVRSDHSPVHAARSTQPAAAVRSTQHASAVSGTRDPASRISRLQSPPSPSSSYVFLGAFTPDDELVGFACYGATPGTDRTFDLYWIAVHRSAQGTGSGTILLTEVERRLEDTDARLFVVETSSRSEYEPTRAFYRARGYAEAARMRDFYAPSDDRIIFTKRFHHPPASGEGAVSR